MKSQLRILYLEDDPKDAELVQETLAIDGIGSEVTRVETEAEFIASLRKGGFDLIFADYTLPSFDGLSALKIAQRESPQVPLIFVSGTLGEEVAIEALKIGATDYVFKTRLSRIVPSVQRALRESEERIDLSRAEEALRQAHAELVHVTRVTALGELTASIAHEINQPLTAVLNNASACLRWLAGESPDLYEAREAVGRIVRDGNRASDVIARMRALFRKGCAAKEQLDLNEAIKEITILTQSEIRRNKVALRMEMARDLPSVMGDRVQLQQVVMNLILNGIEAMSTLDEGNRGLLIRTQSSADDEVLVAVRDSGIGLDPRSTERIFDAFHTTKPGGLGMGLKISRSIVEWHGGRLWAVPNHDRGATFQFTLPKLVSRK
jgi:C4-dicarboxylate-specific signal transduction histidine kinase